MQKKRDYEQKKIEIQIDYLKKEIEYLAQIENEIMLVSREVINCIGKNCDERVSKYNEVIGKISVINERNIAVFYMLQAVNESCGIDIDLKSHKKVIGNCIDRIQGILDLYMNKSADHDFKNQIGSEVHIAVDEIQNTTNIIAKYMAKAIESMGKKDKEKRRS